MYIVYVCMTAVIERVLRDVQVGEDMASVPQWLVDSSISNDAFVSCIH